MKIVTVVGARPQFIKAGAVSRPLAQMPNYSEIVVHTGQHYDANMSEIFFRELELPEPHYHLGAGSGSHGVQTGQMLAALDEVLMDERPDVVLVYGDTNSTLAGALAASKLHIPVAHVEAGLRSFNRRMPEEINRVLTDHVSNLLFAPTDAAVANLWREGISPERIHLTGDVMYDAALYYAERAEATSDVLERIGLTPKEYVLATIHRAENTDDASRLSAIMYGLEQFSSELQVLIPLHPRTAAAMDRTGLSRRLEGNVKFLDPVGYLDMIMLEKHAALVATDSGGVQKEAYFFKVPCVTLRDETEWVELVESGWNRLVSPVDKSSISTALVTALGSTGDDIALYGDGGASFKVIESISEYLQTEEETGVAQVAS